MIPRTRSVDIIIVVIFLLALIWTLERLADSDRVAVDSAELTSQGSSFAQTGPPPSAPSSKREVIGLVFYGRREFVRVLNCYLKVGCGILGVIDVRLQFRVCN